MFNLDASLAQAKAYHRGRQLERAERIYRQILKAVPTHFETHYLLGNIYQALGKLPDAIACFEESVRLKPDFDEAGQSLRDARARRGGAAQPTGDAGGASSSAEQWNRRGLELAQQGNLGEAALFFERAAREAPNYAGAHSNLGNAYAMQGDFDRAAACYRRALDLNPNAADALSNLGNVFKSQGNLNEALAYYGRALAVRPNFADALSNMANALFEQRRLDEAVACYRRALELTPQCADAHRNLGAALRAQWKLDDAGASFRQALKFRPDDGVAWRDLGGILTAQGKLDESIACYRRALQLNPDDVVTHSDLLLMLNYCPGYDAKAIYEEHRRWNRQHCEPLAKFIQPHSNERSADRRLRIGYVSPDLRDHALGLNLLPLFREHDHGQFEIVCYSHTLRRDAITDRFEGYADAWRNIVGLTDEAAARQIREDRIDILVDLAQHTGGNRLLIFARKPAPVQVAFAGYPGTTGLATIDYRLTDVHLDPPGADDSHYAEESVRLPVSFWCYDPLCSEPEVNALPAIQAGYITFGCLNNFFKINAPTLKLWARVLRAIDRSRIMMLAPEGSQRESTLTLLEQEGVAPDRVTFVAKLPRQQYLALYHRIDIALDTLPYNGHTTSLESLWMGVPVISLVGQTVVGRAGLCQLMNLGMPEWIAHEPEQFLSIAVEQANDVSRLGELRAHLRCRMLSSPLMDAPRFARNIEAAYREMWRRWLVGSSRAEMPK